MRYYSLLVDNEEIMKLDEKNPLAPAVRFNIPFNNGFYSAPPSIEFINANTGDFIKSNKVSNGKSLMLKAGIKQSAFLRGNNINFQTSNDILICADIDYLLVNWQGLETSLVFVTSNLSANDKATIVGQINQGEVIAQKYKELLEKYIEKGFYKAKYNIVIDSSAQSVLSQSRQTIPIRPQINQIRNMEWFVKGLFKYGLSTYIKNNVITIYKSSRYENEQGENIPTFRTIEINDIDLLQQPIWLNPNEIYVVINLRADIYIGSKIKLTSTKGGNMNSLMNFAFGAMSSLKSSFNASNGVISNSVLLQGEFNVVEVVHNGDSRNPDPMAWCTCIKAILPSSTSNAFGFDNAYNKVDYEKDSM